MYTMTGFLVTLFLLTAMKDATGRRHHVHVTTDLCDHPCLQAIDHTRTGSICRYIREANIKIANMRDTVLDLNETLVSYIYDGDVSWLNTRRQYYFPSPLISVTSAGSPVDLSSINNGLLSLHLVLNFTENHPSNSECEVNMHGLTNKLSNVICDLGFITNEASSMRDDEVVIQEDAFTCQKTDWIQRSPHCPRFQKLAYMALQYASAILTSTHYEVGRLQRLNEC